MILLSYFLSLVFANSVEARAGGDFVGNGGGVWACREQNGSLRWVELVDLFEAKSEFKLNVPTADDISYEELVAYKAETLFARQKSLFALVSPYLTAGTQFSTVDGDLEIIEDSLYRLKPKTSSCVNGGLAYEQVANYTKWDTILVAKEIWESPFFSSTNKAALVFHEAFYKMLRDLSGDKVSVRARGLTAYAFSDLAPLEMSARIKEILESWGPAPKHQVPRTEVLPNLNLAPFARDLDGENEWAAPPRYVRIVAKDPNAAPGLSFGWYAETKSTDFKQDATGAWTTSYEVTLKRRPELRLPNCSFKGRLILMPLDGTSSDFLMIFDWPRVKDLQAGEPITIDEEYQLGCDRLEVTKLLRRSTAQ